MFGGKYPKEELTYPNWFSRKDGKVEGGYRRVPNRDGIALVKGRPVIIRTDKHGVALSEAGRELMKLQNAECIKAKREVQKDYTVIYVPPQFRLRILAFIAGVSLLGIFALTISIGVPVPLGRHIFSFFTSEEVHDGYSFIVGCSLVWTCFTVGKAVNECTNRRLIKINASTNDPDSPSAGENHTINRASWGLFMLKEGVKWIGQVSWLAFWLGFTIPILVSVTVDLYLVFPLRHLADPGFALRIDIPMAWMSGILYIMISLKVAKRQPGPRRQFMIEIDRVNVYFLKAVCCCSRLADASSETGRAGHCQSNSACHCTAVVWPDRNDCFATARLQMLFKRHPVILWS
jgi:E3 ubiquitin-protein ligase MARCH6